MPICSAATDLDDRSIVPLEALKPGWYGAPVASDGSFTAQIKAGQEQCLHAVASQDLIRCQTMPSRYADRCL